MNTATISAIILGVSSSLIIGMAALIKGMVVGKLDSLQESLDEMRGEVHAHDIRITRLETEHRMRDCNHRGGE